MSVSWQFPSTVFKCNWAKRKQAILEVLTFKQSIFKLFGQDNLLRSSDYWMPYSYRVPKVFIDPKNVLSYLFWSWPSIFINFFRTKFLCVPFFGLKFSIFLNIYTNFYFNQAFRLFTSYFPYIWTPLTENCTFSWFKCDE